MSIVSRHQFVLKLQVWYNRGMNQLLLFIALLAILAVLVVILLYVRGLALKNQASRPVSRPFFEEQTETKNRKLELILGLFGKHETLTNAIIRQELGFDDRVIVNYMDELEKTGKVAQVGKVGKFAHYKLR